MEIVIQTSQKDQIIDITNDLNDFLKKNSLENGVLTVFVKHTTCGLTTADLDPGTDLDFLSFLRKISPNIPYNHPHDPGHTPDHLLSSLIGPSVTVPFKNGAVDLGTWQRVILVELNGPKNRKIELSPISVSLK